jgi:hypothetical protein
MKAYKFCLLIGACAVTTAQAQLPGVTTAPVLSEQAPTRVINEPSANTGTLIRKDLRWNSKIPLNKTWEQLTPEQQAEFRSLYESMPQTDEPPFPAEGLRPVFGAIKKAQNVLQAKGELNLAVTVGPDGKATKVEDFGGVDNKDMTQFAGSVLLMTRYKPATCNGSPCTMQFPFRLKLK